METNYLINEAIIVGILEIMFIAYMTYKIIKLKK